MVLMSPSAPGVSRRTFAARTSFSDEDAVSARLRSKPIFFLRFRRRRNSRSLSLPMGVPECFCGLNLWMFVAELVDLSELIRYLKTELRSTASWIGTENQWVELTEIEKSPAIKREAQE
jgi:hypothetical protein